MPTRTVSQRRPIPPTFSSTSTVAHGIASSRSRGIGRPDSDRVAVGAVGDAHQGGVDVGDGLAGLRRQRQVALALDDHRVALAALVVELHVAHLAVLDQRVRLVLEAHGLADELGPLVEQRVLLRLEELGVEVLGVGDPVLGGAAWCRDLRTAAVVASPGRRRRGLIAGGRPLVGRGTRRRLLGRLPWPAPSRWPAPSPVVGSAPPSTSTNSPASRWPAPHSPGTSWPTSPTSSRPVPDSWTSSPQPSRDHLPGPRSNGAI